MKSKANSIWTADYGAGTDLEDAISVNPCRIYIMSHLCSPTYDSQRIFDQECKFCFTTRAAVQAKESLCIRHLYVMVRATDPPFASQLGDTFMVIIFFLSQKRKVSAVFSRRAASFIEVQLVR